MLQPGLPCLLAADIYALGMILFELLARKIPFQERRRWSMEKLSQSIIAGDRPNLPVGPTDFKELIQRCWSQRVIDRPVAKEVVQSLENSTVLTACDSGETIAPTAPIFFNPIPAPCKDNQFIKDLQFIQHVVSGTRKEAETLLKKTPRLAFSKFKITDQAGRNFSNITALQYALWALDWSMYEVIATHLPIDVVQQQAQQQEALTLNCGHNRHYQLRELLQDRVVAPQNIPAHISNAMPNTPQNYTIRHYNDPHILDQTVGTI